ncbi:MAG: 50S ribosomal protein L2 [archaeon]|nr:50S ribosomal protein L2 [archaeon]
MAHRLIQQRRGKGSPTFIASRKGVGKLSYPNLNEEKKMVGEIIEFLHDPTKSSALARVMLEDNSSALIVAAEGAFEGQRIEVGKNAEISVGNILPLGDCPEGAPVFSIEMIPGDGGKIARASGSYALILSKEKNNVTLKARSGKILSFNARCRATIGMASGGGRTEKPLVKAGAKYHKMRVKKKFWPIVRGVAMNVIDHPFGGSQHHPGKSKSTSRNAPPGRKVGAIASKRTGRKKKN